MCDLPKINIPIINGIIIAMGGIQMGLGLAYCSPTIGPMSELFGLSELSQTMFNVAGYLAAMVGAIVINPFIKKFGKRNSSFGSAIFTAASWICLALSTNKYMAYAFRIATGTGIGFYSTISPVFILDVAPVHQKGLFGFMNQLGIAIGYLIIAVVGNFVNWRALTYICSIPMLIQVLFVMFVPEPATMVVKVSFGQVFKYPKQLTIALLLMFFLQFSGINAVLSNMNSIIGAAGLDVSTTVVGIAANCAQLFATLVASFVVDRLGQKTCWAISSTGQMVAFFLLFAYSLLSLPSWTFMAGLFLEQFAYGLGTGPVPFTKAAQLFRVEVRPAAMGVATATQWFLGALVCYVWPTLQAALGLSYSFLAFGIVMVFSLIFGFIVLNPSNNADNQEDSDDQETEKMSRRMSHAMDVAEL